MECPKCHRFNDFAFPESSKFTNRVFLLCGTYNFGGPLLLDFGKLVEGETKAAPVGKAGLSSSEVDNYLKTKAISEPLTREVVLALISLNGGTALGLDLSGRALRGIDLSNLDLTGIVLRNSTLDPYRDERGGVNPSNLNYTRLAHANLESIHLNGASLLRTDFTSSNLKAAEVKGAKAAGAIFFTSDLRNTDLSWSDLDGADFNLSQLDGAFLANSKITSQTSFGRALWNPQYILGDETRSFKMAEETYRQLKTWHQNAGIYYLVGEFHFREWVSRRKNELRILAISAKNQRFADTISGSLRATSLLIAESLCGYGERWSRVVFWSLAAILSFAIAYYLWCPSLNSTFLEALLFSGASFTSLGYDISDNLIPMWVRQAGVAESFLGAFLMALFLITFVRRWTR